MKRSHRQGLWLAYGFIFLVIAGGTIFLTSAKSAEMGFVKEDPVFITRLFLFDEQTLVEDFPLEATVSRTPVEKTIDTKGTEIAKLIRPQDSKLEPPPILPLPTPNAKSESVPNILGGMGATSGSVSVNPPGPDVVPWMLLAVTYPNQVDIGDSVKITIDVASPVVSQLPEGGLYVRLESGALEWSQDGDRREIKDQRALPTSLVFSPGTKDTGKATVVIYASAAIPIAISTRAGSEEPTAAGATDDKAKESLGAMVPKETTITAAAESAAAGTAPQQRLVAPTGLALETSVDVTVLSKWHLPDSWVHWLKFVGWIAGAIGAGAMLKGIGGIWQRKRGGDQGPQQVPHT